MDELEKIEMPVDIEDIGITFMYDFANLVSVSGFSTYTKNVIEFIETNDMQAVSFFIFLAVNYLDERSEYEYVDEILQNIDLYKLDQNRIDHIISSTIDIRQYLSKFDDFIERALAWSKDVKGEAFEQQWRIIINMALGESTNVGWS